MSRNVGSIRKVILAGISFDVMADANITFNRSRNEREGVPTSGDTLQKLTKRVQTIEGLTIAALPPELEALKQLSDSLESGTISIEFADTSVYRAVGTVYLENWESESGQASVTLIPDGDWTPFLA